MPHGVCFGSELFMTRQYNGFSSGSPACLQNYGSAVDPQAFPCGMVETEQGSTAFKMKFPKYLYYRWKY
jgi:hypothetical protein